MTSKNVHKGLTLALVLVFLSPLVASGRTRAGGGIYISDPEQLEVGTLLIINKDTKKVTFQLRDKKGKWTTQKEMEPGEQRAYDADAATAIRIQTDDKAPVTRTLKQVTRYQIVWDASAHTLDVQKIAPGKAAK